MIIPELLPNEDERLAELCRYDVLDSPLESDFNEIVELAARLCEAEISLISLVDDRRQWFKARYGLDASETPKELAFCAHAIHGNDVFEIPNAIEDNRFWDNPLVTNDPKIRFYAGKPIASADGFKFGTLCVIDRYPRQLTEPQRHILTVLARQVERQLELRLRVREYQESLKLINAQKNTLAQLNRQKDQTLSVLCHDLRNPLAGLQTTLELLDAEIIQPAEAVNVLTQITPTMKQLSGQLKHVLDWVKSQMDDRERQCCNFGLDRLVKTSLEWIASDAEQKGIELRSEVAAGLVVLGHEELLEVVLRNLLCNAVKYTGKGDQVILFADRVTPLAVGDQEAATSQASFADRCDEQLICVGVRDTGIGIKEEDIHKVLSSDVQFSTLGTAREKGTGLGLLLCQTYLQKMNTTLQVKSQWMQGCEFSFLLPQGAK